MPTVQRKRGEKPVLVVEPDECAQCFDPIEIGQDYCGRCEATMLRGLEKGRCGFCDCTLPAIEDRDGYCPDCGRSLVNGPTIESLRRKPRRERIPA